ncbi:AraC family transcriptional regulator [Mesorhizobium sp. Cs1299R1N1]|uniref:AraC family transcriptional regulator n=1 Tax=Mesorhizobium sp. Cs1299R1N1 TaxID=3015172 RepID=UPI003FA5A9B9
MRAGMRVSDIAMISGFSDVSYFNRCFRLRFGRTQTSARWTWAPPRRVNRRGHARLSP